MGNIKSGILHLKPEVVQFIKYCTSAFYCLRAWTTQGNWFGLVWSFLRHTSGSFHCWNYCCGSHKNDLLSLGGVLQESTLTYNHCIDLLEQSLPFYLLENSSFHMLATELASHYQLWSWMTRWCQATGFWDTVLTCMAPPRDATPGEEHGRGRRLIPCVYSLHCAVPHDVGTVSINHRLSAAPTCLPVLPGYLFTLQCDLSSASPVLLVPFSLFKFQSIGPLYSFTNTLALIAVGVHGCFRHNHWEGSRSHMEIPWNIFPLCI